MDANIIESNAAFSFCFNGENKVDALVLSKTIADFAEMVQIIMYSQEPDAKLGFEVTSFRQGSFDINFVVLCQTVVTIFGVAVALAGLASTTTTIIKNVFEIKKHARGSKPREIQETSEDKVKIVFESGTTLYLAKGSTIVLADSRVDNLASDIAKNSTDAGFSISTESERASYTAEDARIMAEPFTYEKTLSEIVSFKRVELPIKKADVLGNSSWEFRYEGRTIKAAMHDSVFLNHVHTGGESIAAGDKIVATLAIETTVDDIGAPVNQKYTVQEVHGGIVKYNQINLFDN